MAPRRWTCSRFAISPWTSRTGRPPAWSSTGRAAACGARRVSTATTFLAGWALQGAYVVWLPLEVAIIHRRTRDTGRQHLLTRRAAAILVGALELSVIIGAATSGLLVEATSMSVLLMLPAIVVTAVVVIFWLGKRKGKHSRTVVEVRRL